MNWDLPRSATAMLLGLALWGIAKADGPHDYRFDKHRFEGNCNTNADQDFLQYFDRWQWQSDRNDLPLDWDEFHYFDHWWFDFAPDDLRLFHYWRVKHYCFHHGHR